MLFAINMVNLCFLHCFQSSLPFGPHILQEVEEWRNHVKISTHDLFNITMSWADLPTRLASHWPAGRSGWRRSGQFLPFLGFMEGMRLDFPWCCEQVSTRRCQVLHCHSEYQPSQGAFGLSY